MFCLVCREAIFRSCVIYLAIEEKLMSLFWRGSAHSQAKCLLPLDSLNIKKSEMHFVSTAGCAWLPNFSLHQLWAAFGISKIELGKQLRRFWHLQDGSHSVVVKHFPFFREPCTQTILFSVSSGYQKMKTATCHWPLASRSVCLEKNVLQTNCQAWSYVRVFEVIELVSNICFISSREQHTTSFSSSKSYWASHRVTGSYTRTFQ